MSQLDPVTFAVVRNALVSAAREMRSVFKRTTLLPVIYEYNDFGMSLYDDQVRLIADAPGLPIFLGSLDFTIERTLEGVGGRDNLSPGDVIFNNHPYLTGGHPADAAFVAPIFYRDELIAFGALRAHIGDMGGMNFYPINATEIFQEGTIFPAVKLYDAGSLNDAIIETLKANSRLPVETAGSVFSAAGALNIAGNKVERVVDEYGIDIYRATVEEIFNHGERSIKKALEDVPDGTYSFEDYMDDNGVDDEPVRIHCVVTVEGTEVTVDLSGSAEEQRGAINCPWGYTVATCRFAVKRITTPDLPPSSGEYRSVRTIAPDGSIFNPRAPAATFAGFMTSVRLTDVVIQALVPALPERMPAENGGDLGFVQALVKDPESGRASFFFDDSAIGHGAIKGKDGMSALVHCWTAGIETMPLEIMETRMPLRKNRSELIQDSAGPGEFRGGLAAETEFEFVGTGVALSVTEKSRASTVKGICGGSDAREQNTVVFFPGTERELRGGKLSDVKVAPGDRVVLRPAGGGGYGNPLDRDPARVAWDIRNGYVSVQQGEEAYGVVIDPQTFAVEHDATDRLRKGLAAGRSDHQRAPGETS